MTEGISGHLYSHADWVREDHRLVQFVRRRSGHGYSVPTLPVSVFRGQMNDDQRLPWLWIQ